MNKGNDTAEDVNTAHYTSIMNKYSAEEVGDASDYPRLTSAGADSEYMVFSSKAGQGNFPGFNIIAGPTTGDVFSQIRKEAVIAIKAFSDIAVSDDYYINPPADADYEYVYFYLTGKVKKMKRSDLSIASAGGFIGGEFNVDDYWVYLSCEGGSGAALGGVSNGKGHLFVKVLQFGTNNPLIGATVKVTSGASTFTAVTQEGQQGYVGFSDIPEGSVNISISYTGAVTFPNGTYYTKSGEIIVSPSGYEGCQMNSPYTVHLKLGSLGLLGFYEETMEWSGEEWQTHRKAITDSVVTTSDFSINTSKSGGFPRNESYITNLSETLGKQELLDGDRFLTYGHYNLTVSAYSYRTYRQEIEAKVYGISDYSGNYEGFTSPYEYPIILRQPTGQGSISGYVKWESDKQPLFDAPEGLVGSIIEEENYGVRTRVKLTNRATDVEYYSEYFSVQTEGEYEYSISNLPDGEYDFEIDSPYGYTDMSDFPETVVIDGRKVIVSGSLKQNEADTGKLQGMIFYDEYGNYDCIPSATITLKRYGNASASCVVDTSDYGEFESNEIKTGFYQVVVELTEALGGYRFYYRVFISGTHNVELYLTVPFVQITGDIIPFIDSDNRVTKSGTLSDVYMTFTRTNSNQSVEYSEVSCFIEGSGVNAIYSKYLTPGYYYLTIESPCFTTYASNVFCILADTFEDYQVYINSSDKSSHKQISNQFSVDGHWEECENCETVFDFGEHLPSAWTLESTENCYVYCTVCEYILEYPTAHTIESYTSEFATCTADGLRTYYCSKGCGYSYSETLKATGHKGNGVWVYDKNGSAKSVGTHHQNCSVCSVEMNSKTACSRGGFTKNNDTNHYDACKTCGGKRYFNHGWKESSRTGYTCTGGKINYKCSDCAATKTGSYAATASHNENARCNKKHAASFTSGCSVGGSHKWNGYYHILCSVCGQISDASSKWCAMHVSSTRPAKTCPA